MPRTFQTFAVRRPDPEAAEAADRALDLLAGAIADLLIAEARSELAEQLGVAEASLDRQRGRARTLPFEPPSPRRGR